MNKLDTRFYEQISMQILRPIDSLIRGTLVSRIHGQVCGMIGIRLPQELGRTLSTQLKEEAK